MQELLRWLATWKGLEIEAGTELRVELVAWPQGGLGLLILVGLLLAFAGVAWIYRRDGDLTRGQRITLGSLRGLAILIVLIITLEPNLVAVKRDERPGHTLLLIDVSQSMSQVDSFRRDGVQDLADAWRALGVDDPGSRTRMELVAALLGHEDQALLRRLSAHNDVQVYGVGSTAAPIPLVGQGDDAAAPRLAPGSLVADGRYTNLGGAVRAALDRSREAAVAGVILITDGRRNVGPQGAEVARLLTQFKVPHTLALGVGDPSETQSITLTRVDAPEKVFQNDPFRVSVNVAAQGYDETDVTVRLLRVADRGSPGDELATRVIKLGGESSSAAVDFEGLMADQAGAYTYKVELQPPDGEPMRPQDHAAFSQVEVLGEQTRVLLISGGPSHEYRVLRNTLTRDKTVELRCWLTSADSDFPQDGNVSIKELPADREAMDLVDVIILIDPDSTRLTRQFSELAARHVVENGAGMWWVCGEKFTLEAIRDAASTKPLSELLPVVPDLVRADRRIVGFGHAFDRAWPYELTPDGRESKVVRLLDQRDANALLWPRLPGYHFAFPVLRSKPLATPLVRLANPELARSQGAAPLIAMQLVGAGRVLYTGTDETYRWRSSFEEVYNKFWVKGVRFLFEGRLSSGSSRLRISVSEDELELGESLTIGAEARDEAYHALTRDHVELTLTFEGSEPAAIKLAAVDGVPGSYQATIRPDSLGFYSLAAPESMGRAAPASFQVVPAAIERGGPVDLAELAAITDTEGGELLRTPEELLTAVDRIPSMRAIDTYRTPYAIWDTWVTVLLLVGVLAFEWYLRKKANLL